MIDSRTEVSTLGYALLGLLQMYPNSGYGLRKIFTSTPMANFSNSPGAIYPALKKLESLKLINGTTEPGETNRPKQVFHVTTSGKRVLESWLRQPVTAEDMARRPDIVMLRFSYLDLIDDREISVTFVTRFLEGVRQQLVEIRQLRKSLGDKQPLHGRLALDHGMTTLAAHEKWAIKTLKHLETSGEAHS